MTLLGGADHPVVGAPLRSALAARFGDSHRAMADAIDAGAPIAKVVPARRVRVRGHD